MWTTFRSSRGLTLYYRDTEYRSVSIEASRQEAIGIFEKMFGADPTLTSCRCCGPDYFIHESEEPLSESLLWIPIDVAINYV